MRKLALIRTVTRHAGLIATLTVLAGMSVGLLAAAGLHYVAPAVGLALAAAFAPLFVLDGIRRVRR